MKNINIYIKESLLDDEDDLINNHRPIILNKIKQLFRRSRLAGDCAYKDTYNRKLEVGDLVIFYYGASIEIGIIDKFIQDGSFAFVTFGEGTMMRKVYCPELMKIPNDKLFLELIK